MKIFCKENKNNYSLLILFKPRVSTELMIMGHSPGQVRMCDTDLHVSQLLHDVAVSGVRESLSFFEFVVCHSPNCIMPKSTRRGRVARGSSRALRASTRSSTTSVSTVTPSSVSNPLPQSLVSSLSVPDFLHMIREEVRQEFESRDAALTVPYGGREGHPEPGPE